MIRELTTHLWQSTGFAVVAALMTFAFRRNQAKVRYALWLSASLKFFVPFSILMSLGSHLGWTPATRSVALPQVSFVMERIAEPFGETLSFAPSAPTATDWIHIAILGVWFCGFAAIVLMRARSLRGIRAAMHSSVPLAIPAAVEIRTSPGVLEPGVVGLMRPILLLPEGIAERLTPPQLEAVLAHELCHVRRRDNLFASLHMIVEAVYWFHPLVWWIGARMVEERERACDEAVLSLGNEPRTYADAILNVCMHYVQSPLVCVSGVTGANLKRRIEAIVTNSKGHSLNRAKKLLLATAGIVALAGPVAIGVVIGIGHVPALRAQSPATAPPITQTAQAAPAMRLDPPPRVTVAPQAPAPETKRRLLAVLFDLDTMPSEDRARARQAALKFVEQSMKESDAVAVLLAENGAVRVAQDFTSDHGALESAIAMAAAGGNASAAMAGSRNSIIETAAQLLAALPAKKSLLYFSSGDNRSGADDATGLRRAIDAAKIANLAIYAIDARGFIPQNIAQPTLGDGSVEARAGGVSDAEYNRRVEYARTAFGSVTGPLSRTYIQHGPPDTIDDRGFGSPNGSQIWRYGYLENFRSNVEFEFTSANRATGVRINWPPPSATYEGTPSAVAELAGQLDRADSAAANVVAGFPGRHSSFQTYPAGEWQTLQVPLDLLSGKVDILGQIKTRPQAGSAGRNVANVMDSVDAAPGMTRVNFYLVAGSYTCKVVVREHATGKVFGETVDFEVK